MSRYYQMELRISGHNPMKKEAIKNASAKEWPFEDWQEYVDEVACTTEASLCGGESEEAFVERLAVAIWQANEAYREIYVTATYLENLPYEEHVTNRADYERLIGNTVKNKETECGA